MNKENEYEFVAVVSLEYVNLKNMHFSQRKWKAIVYHLGHSYLLMTLKIKVHHKLFTVNLNMSIKQTKTFSLD